MRTKQPLIHNPNLLSPDLLGSPSIPAVSEDTTATWKTDQVRSYKDLGLLCKRHGFRETFLKAFETNPLKTELFVIFWYLITNHTKKEVHKC